ncbi:hypothetical protein [Halpernia frigidisoli]|uniref:DUF4369 domain-containing protein n=1 Tax=Halpernia frigidisoli TaxID=1125876 RepID=A0A1I3GN27_9FLAO|nr:hypothetical protein [Halpernia frigidisoli]SFI24915.1 hypothetical protein SAMN05443292_1937 [Halpernia frigidisoli]
MKFLFISLFLVLCSCKTNGDEQARAYIEGKITTSLSTNLVELQLKSENVLISKTTLDPSKNFVLSGPLLGKTFFLVSNQKIKKFTASAILKISKDSLILEFPAGKTYINDLELTLNK